MYVEVKNVETEGAALIVHDSTPVQHGQKEKWEYLQELEREHNFFLILSTNLLMAHARSMCLHVGQELYAPDYIAMMEDDHGYKTGFIGRISSSMKKYYGKTAPNGLKYGLFTGCKENFHYPMADINNHKDKSIIINKDTPLGAIGGENNCFRCAPTHHWNNILKGYDTDEYLISSFQKSRLCFQNYHKGFTNFLVQNGELMFNLDALGRGTSANTGLRLWDNEYIKSDHRSCYLSKHGAKEPTMNRLKRNTKNI